jgi:hypothetical protein
VTAHWKKFAPGIPIERFIAQEILEARAGAFEACGWYYAARVCRDEIALCGETEIDMETEVTA